MNLTPADIAEVERLVESANAERERIWRALIDKLGRNESLCPHIGPADSIDFTVPEDSVLAEYYRRELADCVNKLYTAHAEHRRAEDKLRNTRALAVLLVMALLLMTTAWWTVRWG